MTTPRRFSLTFCARPRMNTPRTRQVPPRRRASSLDHLVGAGEEGWREFDPKGPCCPEVDDELESLGLINGQLSRGRAFQNLIDVGRRSGVQVREARTVAEQNTSLNVVRLVADSGQ